MSTGRVRSRCTLGDNTTTRAAGRLARTLWFLALSPCATKQAGVVLVLRHARRLSFSSLGFSPLSLLAGRSFFLPATPLRRAPCPPARENTPRKTTLASAHADMPTPDERTTRRAVRRHTWLTGTLHDGGIRSVRSPPRRAPLLAAPIAKPFQCGRP